MAMRKQEKCISMSPIQTDLPIQETSGLIKVGLWWSDPPYALNPAAVTQHGMLGQNVTHLTLWARTDYFQLSLRWF